MHIYIYNGKCEYGINRFPVEILQDSKENNKYIGIAEKVVCEGSAHLETFFQDIIDHGGEGVILRNPASPLEPGRSHGYLKHKVSVAFFLLSLALFIY